jgi:hypothetical protein
MRLAKVTIPHPMEAQQDDPNPPAAIVVIEPGRAPAAVVLGAVDAALRSELPGLLVAIDLPPSDARSDVLKALCGADARVLIGTEAPRADVVFEMPARARPEPRTLPAVAAMLGAGGAGSVEVAVPGRWAALAGVGGHGKLRARGNGSGTRTVRAAAVGLRSTASRSEPGPPPQGDLASERAEHLRHRARSATMRARMDRNAHRLSRERLQTRHERARLRLAEQRLGATGAGEWVRWRSRNLARRAAGLPAAAASATSSARGFVRRARRYAVDRVRTRKLDR